MGESGPARSHGVFSKDEHSFFFLTQLDRCSLQFPLPRSALLLKPAMPCAVRCVPSTATAGSLILPISRGSAGRERWFWFRSVGQRTRRRPGLSKRSSEN